ncbi:MAG: CHAT domain-containing protein, partial [Planctomycetota bacterium]
RSHIVIGSYLAHREEFDEAKKHYEAAIRVAGGIPGGGVTAQCLQMLSRLESNRENHDAAIDLAKKAVEAARRIPQTRPQVGTGLSLVMALAKAGKYKQAFGVLQAVSRIPHAHDDPTFSIAFRANEASLQLELGKTDVAAKIVRELVAETTTFHHGLGAELAAATRSNLWYLFDTGVGIAQRTNDPKLLFTYQEKGRAAVLLESLGGANRVRLAIVPSEVREEFERSQYGYRNSQVRVKEAKRAGLLKVARERRKEVEVARRRMLDALEAIERETAQAKELIRPAVPDLDSVRAGLAPDAALVSYSVIGLYSCALVATRDSARIVSVPVRKVVAEQIDAARLAESDADVSASIAALHKSLIAPLALDKKFKRVILSPNAPVAQVPFCALMPDRQIIYIPSMATSRELGSSKRAAGSKVLALGDPKYTGSWKPLPHTRAEAEAIGDVVLLGGDANRTALNDALGKQKSWRAVHFACHGIVDLESPSLSGLALTDGRLTYFDILQMEIPCDLVALSACETGRGKTVRNEGVFGLTRAFMAAGAKRVLVSLWPVEDEATQVLMKEFYRHWRTGKVSPGDALHRAQAHVRGRKKWSHPAYWAAWQLWGAHQ